MNPTRRTRSASKPSPDDPRYWVEYERGTYLVREIMQNKIRKCSYNTHSGLFAKRCVCAALQGDNESRVGVAACVGSAYWWSCLARTCTAVWGVPRGIEFLWSARFNLQLCLALVLYHDLFTEFGLLVLS